MARPSPLTEALRRIAERYLIEAETCGKPSDECTLVRQTRASPLLDELEQWLRSSFDKLSRKSDTLAAIQHELNL